MSDDETEKLFDRALGEIAREYMKKKRESELSEPTGDFTELLVCDQRINAMDKTNRVVKITRRMTEIEELRANGDLSPHSEEELCEEYDELEQELIDIEPAH